MFVSYVHTPLEYLITHAAWVTPLVSVIYHTSVIINRSRASDPYHLAALVYIKYQLQHTNKLIQTQWSTLCLNMIYWICLGRTLIARFMGPTWGPYGSDRTQVGPMLAHEFCWVLRPQQNKDFFFSQNAFLWKKYFYFYIILLTEVYLSDFTWQ